MKNSLLVIFVLIQSVCFAQKGYMGKRSMVSIDVLNAVAAQKFCLNYRFCMGEKSSLLVEYSKQITTSTLTTYDHYAEMSRNYAMQYYSNYNSSGTSSYSSYPSSSGTVDKMINNYNVSSLGVSFLFGGGNAGMSHPLGYYWGIGGDHYWGTLDSKATIDLTYNSSNYSFSGNYAGKTTVTERVKYQVAGTSAKIIIGRTWYVIKNFTIDLNLNAGLIVAHANGNSTNSFIFDPVSYVPKTLFYFNGFYRESDNGILNQYVNVGFLLQPKLSIGYMF